MPTNPNFACNDVDQYNLMRKISQVSDTFSILHLNVQRISRLDKFDRLKEYMKTIVQEPMIISFVETWFKTNETGEHSKGRNQINMFSMEGYKAEFCSRNERSGGIAIYFKNGLNYEVLERSNGAVSYVHVKIIDNKGQYKYATFVYMPKFSDHLLLFDTLESLFMKVNGHNHG